MPAPTPTSLAFLEALHAEHFPSASGGPTYTLEDLLGHLAEGECHGFGDDRLALALGVRVAEATGFEVTGEPVEQAPGEGYVRLRVPLEQAGGGPAVATSRLRTGRSARSSSPSTKQPQDHERAQLLGTGPQRRPPGECPE